MNFSTHSHYFQNIRQLHRLLAPIMLLSLLLTIFTGTAYQVVDLAGQGKAFKWLLHWHKGQFGAVNLEVIYPFFNALGLFVLLITGFSLWRSSQRTSKKQLTQAHSND